MPILTIDTSILLNEATAKYVNENDRRVRQGFRFALEALGIALPDYANRGPYGASPGKRLRASYAADQRDHRDRAFTPDGNRRKAVGAAFKASPASAAPAMPAAIVSTPRPDTAQSERATFNALFGHVADKLPR